MILCIYFLFIDGLQPDQHFFKVIQLEEALAEYFPEVTIDATTLLVCIDTLCFEIILIYPFF